MAFKHIDPKFVMSLYLGFSVPVSFVSNLICDSFLPTNPVSFNWGLAASGSFIVGSVPYILHVMNSRTIKDKKITPIVLTNVGICTAAGIVTNLAIANQDKIMPFITNLAENINSLATMVMTP